MFESLLIANRGEIAVRIIRACRELGIRSVAVFSEADRRALHVLEADEAYPVGPPPSSESYLRMDTLLEVAERASVEAIHPGYGFLAEGPNSPRQSPRRGWSSSAPLRIRSRPWVTKPRRGGECRLPVCPSFLA